MKSIFFFQRATYGLYEPGMWWNLDIFGKSAFEIRMDYWYLWKTHFLNFRDFQESPNPLKMLMAFEIMARLVPPLWRPRGPGTLGSTR